MKLSIVLLSGALALTLIPSVAGAQQMAPPRGANTGAPPPGAAGGGREGGLRMHHHPPQKAYAACTGATAGQSVQFTSPHGDTIQATCTPSPEGLFARPLHPPGMGPVSGGMHPQAPGGTGQRL